VDQFTGSGQGLATSISERIEGCHRSGGAAWERLPVLAAEVFFSQSNIIYLLKTFYAGPGGWTDQRLATAPSS
jgi:hypothetical protein